MPAFDPVRDAVLHSPQNRPAPLPRKASLALLLTTDEQPQPRRPTSSGTHVAALRTPTPTHTPTRPLPLQTHPDLLPITLPSSDHPRISPTFHSPEDILSFPHRPRPSQSPVAPLSPVAIRDAEETLLSYPHRPSGSPASHRDSPLTLSPPHVRTVDDRPTTSDQPVIPPLLPSPPPPEKPPPLAYNPRRKTPAGNVLIPLSSQEAESYRHSRNPLRISVTLPPSESKVPSKRRRTEQDDDTHRHKRSRDMDRVVEHYNSRPNTNIKQRRDSPIIGLKSFNNWIKSVMIAMWGAPALSEDSDTAANASRRSLTKGKVLDLGCGKGGDLLKWQKARVKLYCGLDIAETSIFQARERASSLRAASGFTAVFNALDCYSHTISRALDKEMLSRPFDVVSMQFCMHYAFESVSKARMMLENVARYLRVGGRFVGTIPNASLLMEQLDEMSPDSDLSFGNAVYKITFEDKKHSLFGQRYHFFLLDAVEDVPEYVVHWDNFVQLAQEHGLHLIERKEFHEIFMDQREHRDYGALLKKMRVVDDGGESQMDEDQWEAANLYIGFAFEKR